MTLASAIIKRAYRKTNLIPLVSSPNSNQTTEALEMLNSLILGIVGNEVGDGLTDINYNTASEHNQSDYVADWVPDNVRVLLRSTAATTLYCDPYPYEGQRLAVIDLAGNLATHNLTVDANGRKIESANTVTMSTNSDNRQWMYRGDTGNWVKITELVAGDSLPFPVEFDPYFVLMLAIQLNPQYGQALHPHDAEMLRRMRSQLRARYCNRRGELPPDAGLVRREDTLYHDTDRFDQGYLRPRL